MKQITPLMLAAMLPFGTLLNQPAPTEVVYKHAAQGDLKLFCFPPVGAKSGEALPVALWIHGGGWAGGNCDSFFPMARYTAARGAASFVVEYRLVKPGVTTVADCVADCKSAVRYLRSHAVELGIDPHRIAVLGESAGGHLAACVGTLDGVNDPADDFAVSARPDALVLYNPLTDFTQSNFLKLFTNGVPVDTDGDGVPDYLEDANGNGLLDSGETSYTNATDLGLRVLITWPRNGGGLP